MKCRRIGLFISITEGTRSVPNRWLPGHLAGFAGGRVVRYRKQTIRLNTHRVCPVNQTPTLPAYRIPRVNIGYNDCNQSDERDQVTEVTRSPCKPGVSPDGSPFRLRQHGTVFLVHTPRCTMCNEVCEQGWLLPPCRRRNGLPGQ